MSARKSIPVADRDKILREAGYRCSSPTCRTTLAIHIHHITQVHQGGGNELKNLLALCPTCHALHHSGIISPEAIREWKARLVRLNGSGLPVESSSDQSTDQDRRGFSLAACEFSWRTCPIGLLHKGRFKKRGFCTFFTKNLAITTWSISKDLMRNSPVHGDPVIWTKPGMAPFSLEHQYEDLGLAVVSMGIIDDSNVRARIKDDKILNYMMSPPLQTPVRFRLVPFVGEHVGILHDPGSTRELRGTMEFAFDASVISYINRMGPSKEFMRSTTSPCLVRIADEGAPVFTADARFIGMVSHGLEEQPGEIGWRHVLTNLIPLREYLDAATPPSNQA